MCGVCHDPSSHPVFAGSWWEHLAPGAGFCQPKAACVWGCPRWDHPHTDSYATASQSLYREQQDKTLLQQVWISKKSLSSIQETLGNSRGSVRLMVWVWLRPLWRLWKKSRSWSVSELPNFPSIITPPFLFDPGSYFSLKVRQSSHGY